MSSSEISHTGLRGTLGRWRRDRSASAAVEFAFIAPMFFGLLFAIFEIVLTFLAGTVLDNGLQQSARKMFTHQAADTNMSQQDFTQDLCGQVSLLLQCSGLRVNVSTFKPGQAITILNPLSNGTFVDSFSYQNPQPLDTVVVSAFYQWPLFVTQLGFSIANIDPGSANGKYLLASTVAFRVEPK
ncbi:MAG: TadE/TadG family type IV pilus assembly protein [Xanthobacteraceae bacterium]